MVSTLNDQPFYNVGVNWSRVFGPTLINEVLVGYSKTTVVADTFDWAGIGDANAKYGIAGGQPIAGLSSIGWGGGLTPPGAIATDSDTLAKTYQINEKLTWLKGRHTLKFGGQFLHYDQQRFYAGNNGLLGFFNFNGAFTGFAFSDFLLDQVSSKGRGGGDPNDPGPTCRTASALFVQDDFKVKPNLTLNLGLRWAYTSPLVEKDNRQSNFDVRRSGGPAQQTFAKDGSTVDRALYNSYYKGFEPRLGVAWKRERAAGVPRRVRHLPVHGGHRRQPAAAAEPAVLLRVGGELRRHDRRRARWRAASPSSCPARRRPATCARTIRTCGPSSPSSGTSSWSTG